MQIIGKFKKLLNVTKSLSAGASLVTKLAMVVATYGTFAGTSLLANVSNAAFGTLCGQTATAFIENDANLNRTFKAAASTDTLKAVVRSAATAGIVHGLTSAFSDTVVDAASTTGQAANSSGAAAAAASSTTGAAVANAAKVAEVTSTFSECVQTALIQSVADTVVSSVMDGIPLDNKLLERGLMSAAINAAAAYGAGQIGNKYLHKKIGTVEHKIYHGLLGAGFGAGIAAIDKRDAGLGALSGMMGAVVAETVAELTAPSASHDAAAAAAKEGLSRDEFALRFSDQVQRSINYGNLSAAISAFACGLEVDIATTAAQNATSNNHSSMMAVMQASALDLYDEIMLERLADKLEAGIPLTPRTRSAQESFDKFNKLYQSLDEVQKEAWRQTGQSPENAANNAYAGNQRLIAEEALAKVVIGESITDYEKQVIVDAAKSGAIHLSTQVAASIGLGVIASTVTKTFVKVAGNKVVTASTQAAREVAQFRSVSGKISETPISWTAPTGTGQTYKVWQRTDIDWNMVRTDGAPRFVGKTNLEAAREGLAPQLPNGEFARVHHIGQNARGPLVEASTRHHDFGLDQLPSGKTPFQILHGQFGSKTKHPDFPVNHGTWDADRIAYWKWRAAQ
jgi:hypothetical protein